MAQEKKKPNITIWLIIVAFIAAGIWVIAVADKSPFANKTDLLPENATLQDILNARKTWDPILTPWNGKPAPNIKLTDIYGKDHDLSAYSGKNLMVVFWATWCPACNQEIPHLIDLRKSIPEDQLAILAISNEPADTLKAFVSARKINYTVISTQAGLPPSPFNRIDTIPSCFFIDSKGIIRLVARGITSIEEKKAILKAF